jgi:hypothetical protein
VTWIMERHLRAQFERLLAEAGDRADGDAADALQARLAADAAEALNDEVRTSSASAAGNHDAEDLARAAAYLDGRLTGPEREAFLTSLAASPRRRADLASAAALLGAIEAEPKTPPADLLARAGAAFAPHAGHGTVARRIFAWRNRAMGWSLATLALLIFVPGALLLVGGRVDWPFHPEAPLRSLDSSAPPRPDEAAPQPAAPAPVDALRPKAEAPAHARESADMARSAQQPSSCETAPAAEVEEPKAGLDAGSSARSASHTAPCPPPIGAAERGKALDPMGADSEHGAAAANRRIPSATPSAILPPVR